MRTSDAHAHRDNFLNDSLMFKVSCTHCVMIKWIAGKKLAGRLDFLKRSLLKNFQAWINSQICKWMGKKSLLSSNVDSNTLENCCCPYQATPQANCCEDSCRNVGKNTWQMVKTCKNLDRNRRLLRFEGVAISLASPVEDLQFAFSQGHLSSSTSTQNKIWLWLLDFHWNGRIRISGHPQPACDCSSLLAAKSFSRSSDPNCPTKGIASAGAAAAAGADGAAGALAVAARSAADFSLLLRLFGLTLASKIHQSISGEALSVSKRYGHKLRTIKPAASDMQFSHFEPHNIIMRSLIANTWQLHHYNTTFPMCLARSHLPNWN